MFRIFSRFNALFVRPHIRGAIREYQTQLIQRVKDDIEALHEKFKQTKYSNEMLNIISRFNALFVRPHIRGAIREYQTQLIQRVKDDIEALHEKFKVQYPQSKCSRLSLVRDLPPVAGSIIWAKQIDHQLTAYLKRVEDVLGKGWENHIEGQKLKADGDSFRLKLDTQEVFDDWARKVQQRNLGVSGRIFAIESVRARSSKTGTILKLKVNFLPEIITLYKEVRNLKNLGFRVPLAIVNKAHQANQLYPFAISLIESVRTYERTLEKIRDKASIIPLVAGLRRDVLNQVSEGMALVWESYKLDPYVQKLSEVVLVFQEKVEDLLAVEEQISVDARSLETCPYSATSLADILSRLQRAIDDLSLRQYSNLRLWVQRLDEEVGTELMMHCLADILSRLQRAIDDLSLRQYSNLRLWVQRLDEEVEKSLAARLQAGIEAWTMALLGKANELDLSMDTYSPAEPTHKPGGEPQVQCSDRLSASPLQAGIEAWTMALLGKANELDLSMDTYSPAEPTHKPGGEPQVQCSDRLSASPLQAGIEAWTMALLDKANELDLSMDTYSPAEPTHKPGGEPQVQCSDRLSASPLQAGIEAWTMALLDKANELDLHGHVLARRAHTQAGEEPQVQCSDRLSASPLQAGIEAWTMALLDKANELDLSMDTYSPAEPTHKPGGEPQVQCSDRLSASPLQAGIEAWTMALLGKANELDLSMDTYSPAEPTHKPGGEPQIARVVHEVRITNQQMYLFPSLEEARFQLMRQMFAWQAVVTSQHRLQSTRCSPGRQWSLHNMVCRAPGQYLHCVHHQITNQQMYLFPSLEEARFQLMRQMFAWQAVVTSQHRLQSTRQWSLHNIVCRAPGNNQVFVSINNQQMYLFPSLEEARFQLMRQMFAWQAVVTSQHRLQSTR
ncbi:dynein heavy chain, cytoplasmic [Phthorimaea operculella]|nr:dynein heavy chain, cytoplasmic [Phthorimaea operculella]